MPPPRSRRRYDDEDDDYDDRPRRRRDDDDEDDEDDRPRRRPRKASGSNSIATVSLVLGILSFVCGLLTGIPAMICGVLGLVKANQVGTGKGMAIGGTILGLIGTILTAVGAYTAYQGTKEVRTRVEQAAGSARANNNLREITLHAHNYHDATGTLPGSYHMPSGGKPPADSAARLSWRYSLLPYAGQDLLYKRFATDQPWDSPTNRPLSATPMPLYADPDAAGSNQTRIRVFVGGGALFDADPPMPKGAGGAPQYARQPKMVSITDGTSNTIFAAEAADTVPWAQHNELWFDKKAPLLPLGRPGRDTFVLAMCDGSTKVVKKSISPEVLKNAITRAGGEIMPPDW